MTAAPYDPSGTTRKIWLRLRMGETPEELEDLVDLLIGCVSWSTLSVEQIIGAISRAKKAHKKS